MKNLNINNKTMDYIKQEVKKFKEKFWPKSEGNKITIPLPTIEDLTSYFSQSISEAKALGREEVIKEVKRWSKRTVTLKHEIVDFDANPPQSGWIDVVILEGLLKFLQSLKSKDK